ncbi:MAG: dTDP-4-dehydrorhamnose reductase [Bacteroidales bacterium]|nr:dTDP-4-dehydrorhamnose reductase [Bacteroidales bacterium]
MTILVTGANGQLGNEMRILARNSQDSYIFTDVNQVEGVETTFLDITDLEAVRKIVEENKVDAIVNCAAWTNVDGAEDPEKFELVEKLNATAPENLATAMKEVNGLLVHISTDYVFGAEPYNTPCKEDQTGTPTGVYGLTKLHGEQKIIATGCNHVIIRTAWLYSEFGKNFCKTMMNLTATKPQLKVVFDQVGTPTYALDLAEAIVVVLNDYAESVISTERGSSVISTERQRVEKSTYQKSGIYHFSNEGVCSWYDFTKMIAEYNGTTDCDVQPCHSNEFPSPVKRPSYSVLDKTKIKETFGIKVPYWTDSLKKCITNLKNN